MPSTSAVLLRTIDPAFVNRIAFSANLPLFESNLRAVAKSMAVGQSEPRRPRCQRLLVFRSAFVARERSPIRASTTTLPSGEALRLPPEALGWSNQE